MSKRKPSLRVNDVPICSIYTYLTWNLCQSCKMEFRREHGWKYVFMWERGWEFDFPRYNYLCATCAPTEQDVYNFAMRKLIPSLSPDTTPNY